mmetsp:Transcript_13450/g.50019  ORF Transcript_13450/g.50019 Transcript_13450/m.50019 type:complete len:208 (+) Transcript_13450:3745-4368(+)
MLVVDLPRRSRSNNVRNVLAAQIASHGGPCRRWLLALLARGVCRPLLGAQSDALRRLTKNVSRVPQRVALPRVHRHRQAAPLRYGELLGVRHALRGDVRIHERRRERVAQIVRTHDRSLHDAIQQRRTGFTERPHVDQENARIHVHAHMRSADRGEEPRKLEEALLRLHGKLGQPFGFRYVDNLLLQELGPSLLELVGDRLEDVAPF